MPVMAARSLALTRSHRRHDEPVPHYFDESPAVGSDDVEVAVDLRDVSFVLRTDRGVFSHGRLDPGTEVLLRRGPPLPAAGDLLDLGCGAGPIAIALALRAPGARVWAVDVNERARELCAANASRNTVTNVRVAHPDDVDPEMRFAAVWSNPPIRIGKPALHDLLATWLARLDAGGSAALVVHKHLGGDSLQRWLDEQGYLAERYASARGSRVLRVTR
jgi:16S rRNA (guanine1207-N2)-methyltransferase